MSWASLANNQCVSFNNLQNAVNTGVFTLKNSIPASSEQITKADADYYVNINTSYGPYAAKASNQLVVKSDLQAAAPACQQIYLYPYNSSPCDHFGSYTLYDTDSAISPTRLWVAYDCNITPVVGGFQWFSQGPGSASYQVDNGGFIVNVVGC
jgi:hypothetical protein